MIQQRPHKGRGADVPYALRGEGVQFGRLPRFVSNVVEFSFKSGEIWTVVAPNGAGKTTFLKTLMGIIPPLQGTFWAQGEKLSLEAPEHRKKLAFAGHEAGLGTHETVQQQLKEGGLLWGRSIDGEELTAAAAYFGLTELLPFPCGLLSKGQMQRLVLCRLYLSRRPFWLLDEPFHNLDMWGIELLRQILQAHVGQGGLAILTSPREEIFGEQRCVLRLN